MIRGLAVLAVVATALALTPPATAAVERSGGPAATVNRVLAELSIPPEDVKSVSIIAQRETTERGRFTGHRAWVRLTSCTGSLVVELSRSGRVTQTYTRGDCALPGVPSY